MDIQGLVLSCFVFVFVELEFEFSCIILCMCVCVVNTHNTKLTVLTIFKSVV